MSHNSNRHPSLQHGHISAEEEKRFLEDTAAHYDNHQLLPSHHRHQPSPQPETTMLSPRRLIVGLAVCLVALVSLTSALGPRISDVDEKPLDVAAPDDSAKADVEAGSSSFSQLLRSASPDSLHRLLHAYFPDRYQHGVYPSDHDAIAAVHADAPELATALVQLARRQIGGNSTTSAAPPPESSSSPPETSSPPPETSSSPPPETSNPPSTSEPAPSSTPPASTSSPPTPSQSSTSSPPGTSSTSSIGSSSSSSSSIESSSSDGSSSSTSSPPESTTSQPESRSTPSSSPVPQTLTSTKPNGEVQLFTQTSWVVVGPAETESETKPSPSLQNAAPRTAGQIVLPALFALVIGGFLA